MHKSRTILCGALLSTLAITVVAFSQPTERPATRPTSRPIGLAQPGGPPPNLERSMKAVQRSLRQINQLIADPANDAQVLALIGELQTATVQAKTTLPPQLKEMPEDERKQATADYHNRMISVLRTELTLEEAMLNGNRDAAKAAIASLVQQRKEGHDAFGVEDDEHERH